VSDAVHVATVAAQPGEEVLLATAYAAATLTEDLNRLAERLYDFGDWQLLNVTDDEALQLEPTLTALRQAFVRHCVLVRALVADVDEVSARLGDDLAETDERFELSLRRSGPHGQPRWQRLAAWWRSTCGDIEERDHIEAPVAVEARSACDG